MRVLRHATSNFLIAMWVILLLVICMALVAAPSVLLVHFYGEVIGAAVGVPVGLVILVAIFSLLDALEEVI